jgi:hypothetical protein
MFKRKTTVPEFITVAEKRFFKKLKIKLTIVFTYSLFLNDFKATQSNCP